MSLFEKITVSLDSVAKENGLKLETTKLSPLKDYLKLTATLSDIGNGLTRHQRAYIDLSFKYELPHNAIYERLIINNKEYQTLGWESRNKKFPIIVKDNLGNIFKFHPSQYREFYDNCLKLANDE